MVSLPAHLRHQNSKRGRSLGAGSHCIPNSDVLGGAFMHSNTHEHVRNCDALSPELASCRVMFYFALNSLRFTSLARLDVGICDSDAVSWPNPECRRHCLRAVDGSFSCKEEWRTKWCVTQLPGIHIPSHRLAQDLSTRLRSLRATNNMRKFGSRE